MPALDFDCVLIGLVTMTLCLGSIAHAEPVDAIMVSTMAELNAAARAAKPGTVIELKAGRYDDADVRLTVDGTADQPITIRAAKRGKSIVRRTVELAGDHLVLDGVRFEGDGRARITGNDCRVTRCTMHDCSPGKWLFIDAVAQRAEVDHCLFENKTNNGRLPRGCQLLAIRVLNKQERHHIHHNHFRDIPKGKTGNGYETIQLMTKGNPRNPADGHSETVIESNLFERCDGESEIISVKSNGNFLRQNTFRHSRGALVLRHGDANVVTHNFFLGDPTVTRSAGVRLQGTDQIVAGNYFAGLDFGVAMMDGIGDNFYVRVERAHVLFNTFVDCQPAMRIGVNHSKYPNGQAPSKCVVRGNVLVRSADEESKPLIEYVNGDQPESWTWSDNIAYGLLGIERPHGVAMTDPHLSRGRFGLTLPTRQTPTVALPDNPPAYLTQDLLGTKTEPARRTIGAMQYTDRLTRTGPLEPTDVGPDAE